MPANKISRIEISLASPEAIAAWSHGEVTKPETINYKTQKPEPSGLFDERIFGPVKDYECACGKYKKVKNKGKKCEKCGVEITESVVRRERMGHIELAAPVAHTWMIKELPFPSKISLVLNISYKEVEQVVYFVNYIVLQEGAGKYAEFFKKKEVIDLSNSKAAKSSRGVLRKLLRQLRDEDLKKGSLDYNRARIYYERLKDSNLPFSFDEVTGFIGKHTGLRFGIGAEAIFELLKAVDLEKEHREIRQELKDVGTTEDDRAKKLLRRLEVIKWLRGSTNKPEWMIMTRIPVTPPDTRPIIQLDGGRFTTSDINNLYRRIIIRNERLKKILADRSPSIIVNNEKRMLQEAVDALFDNASRRKPIVGKDRRPLKSLTDYLKGKQGRFRQNLLGKRVDYSGRSVITVGPELKIYQCGLPAEMILKLFKPFIIHELIARDPNNLEHIPLAANIKTAEGMIQSQDALIWPVVEKVIAQRPVLLNRAPTLHRLGIQAFEVKMTDGKSIRLHPLVTPAFNADFDGDQMAVHVPLSDEAVAEARSIMLASWNIMGPKDGKPVITPTQDMVLGNYYLTTETKGSIGEGMLFSSVGEAMLAYENGLAHPHAVVAIAASAYPQKDIGKDGMIVTTMGKIVLNSVLPAAAMFINGPLSSDRKSVLTVVGRGESVQAAIAAHVPKAAFGKKDLARLIEYLFQKFEIEVLPKTMDAIKDLGFRFSTRSGITVSAFDVPTYDKKYQYFEKADLQVEELRAHFRKGLLTDDERYSRVVKVWDDVRETVSTDIRKMITQPELKDNPIVIMSDSGARGNLSNFTQLSGMRGLMSKSYNYDQNRGSKVIKDTIETPIKHSFIEGLTVSEYFNSSFGARKGMSDTAMKTSKAGYMTRKLVDATQEVVVREEDCGATKGIVVTDIVDTKTDTIIEKFGDRITDRYSVAEVVDPKTKAVILHAGDLITAELAKAIGDAGITSLELRSVLHCRNHISVCQRCFGLDLTTRKPIAIGTTIGVIAAQSIGEPGTQLTMRTFHTGGVAGGSNIAQGFERLKQLLDVVTPKPHELAVISEINGTVTEVEKTEAYRVVVKNDMESREYNSDLNSILRVKKGDTVQAGDKITDGSIDVKKLLMVAGIESVRQYLIKEIQRVYRLQGIEISDKYIEVIIRQLTSKQIVQEPGASKLFTGQVIDANELRDINRKLIDADKTPASAISTIFGLDEAPSKSDSFLSAASFQDTKKILIDAAVRGQVDGLYGLKENVILGNIINAGTGLLDPEELKVNGERARRLEY